MRKLLYLLLFIPLISFSQETKKVLNRQVVKDDYIEEIYGITYYMEKPYTGVFYENYENGQLWYRANFKDGKENGLYEIYYENGQLEYRYNYKDGEKNGLYVGYHENGQLWFRVNYKDDKRNGLWEQYHGNGQFYKKVNYKDGKMNGLYEWYHQNGQLGGRVNFKDGQENGIETDYYQNGQLRKRVNYKDGKMNGLYEWYYQNGTLRAKINYKDDEKNGLYEIYYENGKLKKRLNYKDDEKNGLYEEYHENGLLKSKYLYENDKIKLDYRLVIGDTNIEDVNIYDLEAMVKLFLKDCELNNIKLSSDYKITSTFVPLDDGVLAKAFGIFNDEEIIIKVNPKDWSKASNPKRWYILYHELGHDVLNLQHGQGGKMMFNYSEKDYNWEDFIKDKDYMFNSMKSN